MKLDRATMKKMEIQYDEPEPAPVITEPISIDYSMEDISIISIGIMKTIGKKDMVDITVTINSSEIKWDTIKRGTEKEYIIKMINNIG